MIDLGNGNSIDGYSKINVILGKNGSGKSTLLRLIDTSLSGKVDCIRYITPERGGELKYLGNIDTKRANNPNWMPEARRNNRWDQFRQSSVAEFRNLETLVLRSIESDPQIRATDFNFNTEVERINEFLDRVSIVRSDKAGFEIVTKSNGETILPKEFLSIPTLDWIGKYAVVTQITNVSDSSNKPVRGTRCDAG